MKRAIISLMCLSATMVGAETKSDTPRSVIINYSDGKFDKMPLAPNGLVVDKDGNIVVNVAEVSPEVCVKPRPLGTVYQWRPKIVTHYDPGSRVYMIHVE